MDGLEALRERVLRAVWSMYATNHVTVFRYILPPGETAESRTDAIMEAIAEYHRPSIEAECAHDWRVMHQGRAQNSVYNPGHGPQSYVWLWYCAKCREVEEGQFDR